MKKVFNRRFWTAERRFHRVSRRRASRYALPFALKRGGFLR
jgi:hypothetical protein